MGCGSSKNTNNGSVQPELISTQTNDEKKTTDVFSQIRIAIREKNIELIKNLIKNESLSPIQAIDSKGINATCLHFAARYNAYEIIHFILTWIKQNIPNEYTSYINNQDGNGNNASMLCCLANAIEALYIILNTECIDYEAKNSRGSNLDELAKMVGGETEIVYQYFVEKQNIKKVENNEKDSEIKNEVILRIENLLMEKGILNNPNMDKTSDIPEPKLDSSIKIVETPKQIPNTENNFKDTEFPLILESLIKDQNHPGSELLKNITWLRPHRITSFTQGELCLFKQSKSYDISKGILGYCPFFSFLCAIAEYPERLKKIFNSQEWNPLGKYSLNLYKFGILTEIVIDDYLPCDANKNDLLFVKPLKNDLWVPILEKVWAKNLGCYSQIKRISINEALQCCFGAPTDLKTLKNSPELATIWKLLVENIEHNYIVCAKSDSESIKDMGLIPKHAYLVLDAYDIDGYKIIKLRNPISDMKWKGDFCDTSPLWTEKLRSSIRYSTTDTKQNIHDERIFFMTINDFIKYFEDISTCYIRDNFIYNNYQANINSAYSEYFEFLIEREMEVNISIHQKDDNGQDDSKMKYSRVVPILFRFGDNNIIHANTNEGLKQSSSLSTISSKITWISTKPYLLLVPGRYILKLKIEWNSNKQIDTCSITTYSPFHIQIQQSVKNKYKGIIKSLIPNIAKANGKFIVIGNQCRIGIGWINDYYFYFYCENNHTKKWILTINFVKLIGLVMSKWDKFDDNPNANANIINNDNNNSNGNGNSNNDNNNQAAITLVIQPKSDYSIYLKSASQDIIPIVNYKFKSTWND